MHEADLPDILGSRENVMGQALMRSVSRLPWHSYLRVGDTLREQSPVQGWAVLRDITTSHLGLCHKRHSRQDHLRHSDHASKRIAVYCFFTNTVSESTVSSEHSL